MSISFDRHSPSQKRPTHKSDVMKQNEASITAYTVLQGLMYLAKKTPHSYLVDPETARLGECILKCSDEGRKRLNDLESFGFKWKVKLREALLLPGITIHYALRKRCIEEYVLAEIADGIEQVVCLGAGFDSLLVRLAKEHPSISFIEVDHPNTQQFKQQALQEAHQNNLNYLSIDFTEQDLHDRLIGSKIFQPTQKTLYICEGVLMYLSQDDIQHMFKTLSYLSGKQSRIVFTAIEPHQSDQSNVPKLLHYYLKLIGEPLKWTCRANKVDAFLENNKARLISLNQTDHLKQRFLKADDRSTLHYGEYVALAEFD